jgi:hypothetical protein
MSALKNYISRNENRPPWKATTAFSRSTTHLNILLETTLATNRSSSEDMGDKEVKETVD